MFRIGLVMICLALFACKNKKKDGRDAEGFSYEQFSALFREAALPYQLSDTAFFRNRDTAVIRSAAFAELIPDSLKSAWFGEDARIRYTAMAQLPAVQGKKFYLVKAAARDKKIVLLAAFNNDRFGGILPFLVPDGDPSTMQVSSIDKAYSIVKTITQKKPGGLSAEGKDAYEYDAASRRFNLILTNPLNNGAAEVINPIDTFARRHKLAADYVKDKKNYVSVRDGRHPNQLLVFIHLDKNAGACTGELKGDLLMTSANTGIYRQGGDPCVLSFRFTPSSLVVKEDEGCGSHRGLDCSFDGTFTRKKELKPKSRHKK